MPARDAEKPLQVKVDGDGALPQYATAASAGADLRASEDLVLAAGQRAAVATSVHLEIPEGHVGLIWPRSGLAVKHGIDTLAGVVDSDYRGEVRVVLVNHGDQPFAIHAGDRVAQLLIQKVERPDFVPAAALTDTARGAGGFGSTGR
jgi:dUTP pyrophosphatase